MRFHRCVECERKREECRETVRHLDGTIDWVCRQCWRDLHYAAFFPSMSRPAEVERSFLGGSSGS